MNIRNRIITTFGLMVFVVGLAANVFGQTDPRTPTEATLFGMHSLSMGQTARLTVTYAQPPEPVRVGDLEPCLFVRIIFDVYEAAGDGSVRLRFVRRVTREMELDPGDAVSFNYPTSRSGEYISVSTFVRPEETDPPNPIRVAAVATLEIRESGRTLFTLPGVIKGFNPQPEPPAGE